MILDNADNADLLIPTSRFSASSANREPIEIALADCLPRKLDSKRSLLITTRSKHVGESLSQSESCIEVPPFSLEEAKALLQFKASAMDDLSEPLDSQRLLNVLGFIPLAITQAAAFMNRNSMQLSLYLRALEKDEGNLIAFMSKEHQDHRRQRGFPNSVFLTWSLSFNQILEVEPQTAALLSHMAMLDSQRMPDTLLRPLFDSEVDFWTAVGTLRGFALITQEMGERSYTLHPLVQASVHFWLEQRNEKTERAGLALQLLAGQFPGVGESYEQTKTCESMLAHARSVLRNPTSEKKEGYRAALLLNVGEFDRDQGRYESAFPTILEAYNIYLTIADLGRPTRDTLRTLKMLARVDRDRGQYEEAEQKMRQVLKGYTELLGANDCDTLLCTAELADILQSRMKYRESEEMLRRTLERCEKKLGLEDYVSSMLLDSNLALVLQKQGKHSAATDLFRRALETYTKLFEVNHRARLNFIERLAISLNLEGKHEEAEEMTRGNLKEREKLFGVEDPDTLDTLHDLAIILRDQGRYEEAQKTGHRGLELLEKVFGAEDRRTLMTVELLAAIHFFHQEEYDCAAVLYARASEGLSKARGPDHPYTVRCRKNYAECQERRRLRSISGDE